MQNKPVYGRQVGRDASWSGSVATIIATGVVLVVVGLLIVDNRLSYVHVHSAADEVSANDRYVQNGLQNIRSIAGNFSHIFQHSTTGNMVQSALEEMGYVHPPPAKKVPKIAYIFAGSARSFVCPQVHWSIKAHLIDALGGEPHTFVRLSLEDNKNVKTGTGIIFKPEFDEKEVNETLKILNPDILERFSYSNQEEEMKKFHPQDIHTVFRENDQRRYSMFFHRCQAYKLMLRYEKEHNVRFDWVVLGRVDAGWLEPILPIEAYDNDRVWITETGYDRFNDQFMLIPRQFSDYLYDLDTKVKKGVYCLGGPDVETWKCNTTALRARGVSEAKIQSVLPYCCPDILDKHTNHIGRSERIHYKHLETGQIPLGIGRFPTFLTRRMPNGECVGECFRIYAYHYKEYVFRFDAAIYPYLKAPMWPDTRGRSISSRDRNLCYILKEPVYPWTPIKAMDWHAEIEQNAVQALDSKFLQVIRSADEEKGKPKYAIDYSKPLLDPSQRLHPSILLNPKDTEMWRIHPTWNTEGCLTFSYQSKQVVWERCRGHCMSKTTNYMPNQLFFLYVIPTKPKALEFIKPKSYHAPNWFPESTYNHPVGNYTKVVMVNSEPVEQNAVQALDSKFLQVIRSADEEKTKPKYAIDYSKPLLDPSQRLHPSILLNPKDTEMWRIHPTWNTEGCLTFSYQTKQVVWERCRGHCMSKTTNYMPNQLFFLYVIPTKPKALEFIKPKSYHAPNWFPESTYNHPVGNFTKVVMVNSEPVNMDYRRNAYCITATKLALEAPVGMQVCSQDRMDPLQTFLTVRAVADGSHAQSTTGQLRFAARPDLCLCRNDNKVVDFSNFPENDKLFVYKCEWKAHYHKNIFEFELIGS
eukprot:CAMPEP_0185012158 /NCGR_PEP_ID=MMETSP1098-20130426/98159_1 /TAXON_ID=89044 /ORGANISM="Spumella elongata, Strain CCAP 955/1" /LENGTH=864 /DNA_ID=CAMNT_0027541211 /DNA_START=36 /DNA_END=2631 /DNA_ORIENTATION=+